MPFGIGLFNNFSRLIPGLRTRQALQAPQAQIGQQAPQPTPITRKRQVQGMSGGGTMGAGPGSLGQDGQQMAASRPNLPAAPGSMAEGAGVAGLNSTGLITNNRPTFRRPPSPMDVPASSSNINLGMPSKVMPPPSPAPNLFGDDMDEQAERTRQERELIGNVEVARGKMMLAGDAVNRWIPGADFPNSNMRTEPIYRPPLTPTSPRQLGDDLGMGADYAMSDPAAPRPPNPYDEILANTQADKEARAREYDALAAKAPQVQDWRAIADAEVKEKSPWWRLGQFGLGALKGFVGANPNGGSGILGALSGGVSGATGDLYRGSRINQMGTNYANERQGWLDQLGAMDKSARIEAQGDRVINTAAKTAQQYENELANLDLKRQKGQLDEQKFETYKQNITSQIEKRVADIEAQTQDLARKAEDMRLKDADRDALRVQNAELQRERNQLQQSLTEYREGEKNARSKANIESRKDTNKPIGEKEARVFARGEYINVLRNLYKKAGIEGKADNEVIGRDENLGRDITVGMMKRRIDSQMEAQSGAARKKIIDKITKNKVEGKDPYFELDEYVDPEVLRKRQGLGLPPSERKKQ